MKRISLLFAFAVAAGSLVCSCTNAQPLPAAQGAPEVKVVPPAAPAPQPAIETFLAFDAEQKDVTVTNGTTEAHFTFNLTNISSGDVIINFVQTSCGCTVAKLPSTPWKLASKESGEISATMQLAGTPAGGSKIKTLTVSSDKGNKSLYVKATIQAAPPSATEMDRGNNMKMALADRQAVFKGDCAKCHVDTTRDSAGHDKTGKELFAAACGICHQAEHQASFVPKLDRLPEPTSAEFWKNWISHGKPGSLMPAFAKSEGGILSDEQIDSLVKYLTETIPAHPVAMTIPTRAQIKQ
jgi:mono/diheme cytochrome c family protein